MAERSVAVIGAGAAGVAAARRLADAGWRVVVFEKSRGCGGRCATKRWEGQVMDHGAQYVTLRDERFRQAVRAACGPDLRALDAPVIIESGEELLTDGRWYHAGGNSRIVRELAAGLDVRLECRVESVQPDGGGWRMGDEWFERVVSTAPLPQTRALAGQLGAGAGSGEGQVGSRQLAVGRAEVGSGGYAACLTVLMLCDGEGLGRTREVYAFSDRSGHPLAWTACENHKAGRMAAGRTGLVVQASEAFSAEHLESDPAGWSAELSALACARWEVPRDRVIACVAHRWRYARVGAAGPGPELPAGWSYAGDGVAGSRVESAWVAGWEAAGVMLGVGTR